MTDTPKPLTADEIAEAKRRNDLAIFFTVPQVSRLIATIEQRDGQIEKLRYAVQKYGRNGHFDTCQSVLITDEPYPCNCGYQDAIEALAATEPKP